jgi:hypothetical protein
MVLSMAKSGPMTKSGPSRNPSKPQKKRKAQPGGEAAFAAACAIGLYVSLDAQNEF